MRFGSYRVFTFQVGRTIQFEISRLTAAGIGVSRRNASRGAAPVLHANIKLIPNTLHDLIDIATSGHQTPDSATGQLHCFCRRETHHPLSAEQKRARCRISTHGGLEVMRDPVLAGVLSLVIPGVGQLYNGRILAGILWLIITPGFWIGSGGTLGWICHLIAAYTAYSYAKDHPIRT